MKFIKKICFFLSLLITTTGITTAIEANAAVATGDFLYGPPTIWVFESIDGITYGDIIPNGGVTEQNVFLAIENHPNLGLNKISYKKDNGNEISLPTPNSTYDYFTHTFSGFGNYVFNVWDTEGNFLTYNFTIAIKPLKFYLTGARNGETTLGPVKVEYLDKNLLHERSIRYYLGDGIEMDLFSGIQFSEPGTYVLLLMDDKFNTEEAEFTIVDALPPEVSLEGVLNNGITKSNVTVRYDDNDVWMSTYTRYLDGIEKDSGLFLNGTIFTFEGKYVIEVIGHNYASTLIEFIIDKTAPNISLSGVVPGGSANKVTVVYEDTNRIKNALYVYGGKAVEFVSGTEFTLVGSYSIVVEDSAGNTKMTTFKIII